MITKSIRRKKQAYAGAQASRPGGPRGLSFMDVCVLAPLTAEQVKANGVRRRIRAAYLARVRSMGRTSGQAIARCR